MTCYVSSGTLNLTKPKPLWLWLWWRDVQYSVLLVWSPRYLLDLVQQRTPQTSRQDGGTWRAEVRVVCHQKILT